MIEKIKRILNALVGPVIIILGYFLYNRNRELQRAESELIKEKANAEIKANEAERQMARDNANDLVEQYERLKRDD